MKTLRLFGMMLMTIVMAFGFTACGDDDDDNGKDSTDYVGVWIITDTDDCVEAITFSKSSWENVKYVSEDGTWKKKLTSGALLVSGNTMQISGDSKLSKATYSISGNTMTIIVSSDDKPRTIKMTRATGGQEEKLAFLEILVNRNQK